VVLLADPSVLRGRRFANLVLAASDAPLPLAALSRRASRAAGRAASSTATTCSRSPVAPLR
jgi:hypothetical protein